jgi:hypothetical protein
MYWNLQKKKKAFEMSPSELSLAMQKKQVLEAQYHDMKLLEGLST